MRRIQFIELHDQLWFPSFLRDEITDALQFGLNLFKSYAPIAPFLQSAIESTHCPSIVDLCSGGGGPWLDLSRRLRDGSQSSLKVLLTDKYPNLLAFENMRTASRNQIGFYPGPVDAMKVPSELKGFRTMFTSFHHFPPEEAAAMLQNAVDANQGVGIFEITRRAPFTIGLMFLWVLLLIVSTPLIQPFRWSRLLCTFVIPVLPFVLLFDGLISCLRTYRPQELRELIGNLRAPGYRWEIGEKSSAPGKPPITYLIGLPPPGASTNCCNQNSNH